MPEARFIVPLYSYTLTSLPRLGYAPAQPPRRRARPGTALGGQRLEDSAETSINAFIGSSANRCAYDCREKTASITEAA